MMNDDDQDDELYPDWDEFDDRPSKSQLKRDAHELKDLGAALIKLNEATLQTLPLSDELRQAINEARRINKHGALKRQIQFIGKLLRNSDAEQIRDAYEQAVNHFQQDVKHFHVIEQWRDRLLAEGDTALGELISQAPTADRQHIRQLVRSAHKEKLDNKSPRAARELFQYLKSLLHD